MSFSIPCTPEKNPFVWIFLSPRLSRVFHDVHINEELTHSLSVFIQKNTYGFSLYSYEGLLGEPLTWVHMYCLGG